MNGCTVECIYSTDQLRTTNAKLRTENAKLKEQLQEKERNDFELGKFEPENTILEQQLEESNSDGAKLKTEYAELQEQLRQEKERNDILEQQLGKEREKVRSKTRIIHMFTKNTTAVIRGAEMEKIATMCKRFCEIDKPLGDCYSDVMNMRSTVQDILQKCGDCRATLKEEREENIKQMNVQKDKIINLEFINNQLQYSLSEQSSKIHELEAKIQALRTTSKKEKKVKENETSITVFPLTPDSTASVDSIASEDSAIIHNPRNSLLSSEDFETPRTNMQLSKTLLTKAKEKPIAKKNSNHNTEFTLKSKERRKTIKPNMSIEDKIVDSEQIENINNFAVIHSNQEVQNKLDEERSKIIKEINNLHHIDPEEKLTSEGFETPRTNMQLSKTLLTKAKEKPIAKKNSNHHTEFTLKSKERRKTIKPNISIEDKIVDSEQIENINNFAVIHSNQEIQSKLDEEKIKVIKEINNLHHIAPEEKENHNGFHTTSSCENMAVTAEDKKNNLGKDTHKIQTQLPSLLGICLLDKENKWSDSLKTESSFLRTPGCSPRKDDFDAVLKHLRVPPLLENIENRHISTVSQSVVYDGQLEKNENSQCSTSIENDPETQLLINVSSSELETNHEMDCLNKLQSINDGMKEKLVESTIIHEANTHQIKNKQSPLLSKTKSIFSPETSFKVSQESDVCEKKSKRSVEKLEENTVYNGQVDKNKNSQCSISRENEPETQLLINVSSLELDKNHQIDCLNQLQSINDVRKENIVEEESALIQEAKSHEIKNKQCSLPSKSKSIFSPELSFKVSQESDVHVKKSKRSVEDVEEDTNNVYRCSKRQCLEESKEIPISWSIYPYNEHNYYNNSMTKCNETYVNKGNEKELLMMDVERNHDKKETCETKNGKFNSMSDIYSESNEQMIECGSCSRLETLIDLKDMVDLEDMLLEVSSLDHLNVIDNVINNVTQNKVCMSSDADDFSPCNEITDMPCESVDMLSLNFQSETCTKIRNTMTTLNENNIKMSIEDCNQKNVTEITQIVLENESESKAMSKHSTKTIELLDVSSENDSSEINESRSQKMDIKIIKDLDVSTLDNTSKSDGRDFQDITIAPKTEFHQPNNNKSKLRSYLTKPKQNIETVSQFEVKNIKLSSYSMQLRSSPNNTQSPCSLQKAAEVIYVSDSEINTVIKSSPLGKAEIQSPKCINSQKVFINMDLPKSLSSRSKKSTRHKDSITSEDELKCKLSPGTLNYNLRTSNSPNCNITVNRYTLKSSEQLSNTSDISIKNNIKKKQVATESKEQNSVKILSTLTRNSREILFSTREERGLPSVENQSKFIPPLSKNEPLMIIIPNNDSVILDSVKNSQACNDSGDKLLMTYDNKDNIANYERFTINSFPKDKIDLHQSLEIQSSTCENASLSELPEGSVLSDIMKNSSLTKELADINIEANQELQSSTNYKEEKSDKSKSLETCQNVQSFDKTKILINRDSVQINNRLHVHSSNRSISVNNKTKSVTTYSKAKVLKLRNKTNGNALKINVDNKVSDLKTFKIDLNPASIDGFSQTTINEKSLFKNKDFVPISYNFSENKMDNKYKQFTVIKSECNSVNLGRTKHLPNKCSKVICKTEPKAAVDHHYLNSAICHQPSVEKVKCQRFNQNRKYLDKINEQFCPSNPQSSVAQSVQDSCSSKCSFNMKSKLHNNKSQHSSYSLAPINKSFSLDRIKSEPRLLNSDPPSDFDMIRPQKNYKCGQRYISNRNHKEGYILPMDIVSSDVSKEASNTNHKERYILPMDNRTSDVSKEASNTNHKERHILPMDIGRSVVSKETSHINHEERCILPMDIGNSDVSKETSKINHKERYILPTAIGSSDVSKEASNTNHKERCILPMDIGRSVVPKETSHINHEERCILPMDIGNSDVSKETSKINHKERYILPTAIGSSDVSKEASNTNHKERHILPMDIGRSVVPKETSHINHEERCILPMDIGNSDVSKETSKINHKERYILPTAIGSSDVSKEASNTNHKERHILPMDIGRSVVPKETSHINHEERCILPMDIGNSDVSKETSKINHKERYILPTAIGSSDVSKEASNTNHKERCILPMDIGRSVVPKETSHINHEERCILPMDIGNSDVSKETSKINHKERYILPTAIGSSDVSKEASNTNHKDRYILPMDIGRSVVPKETSHINHEERCILPMDVDSAIVLKKTDNTNHKVNSILPKNVGDTPIILDTSGTDNREILHNENVYINETTSEDEGSLIIDDLNEMNCDGDLEESIIGHVTQANSQTKHEGNISSNKCSLYSPPRQKEHDSSEIVNYNENTHQTYEPFSKSLFESANKQKEKVSFPSFVLSNVNNKVPCSYKPSTESPNIVSIETSECVTNFTPKFYTECPQLNGANTVICEQNEIDNKSNSQVERIDFKFPPNLKFRQKALDELIPKGEKIEINQNILRAVFKNHADNLQQYAKRNVSERRRIKPTEIPDKLVEEVSVHLESSVCKGLHSLVDATKVASELQKYSCKAILKGLTLLLKEVLKKAQLQKRAGSKEWKQNSWIMDLQYNKFRPNQRSPPIVNNHVKAAVVLLVLVADRKCDNPAKKSQFMEEALEFCESQFLGHDDNIKAMEVEVLMFLGYLYTCLAEHSGALSRVRNLIYDLLYGFTMKGHCIIFTILSTWPDVLKVKPIHSYLDDPVTLAVVNAIFCTPNTENTLRERKKITSLVRLMKQRYNFDASTTNADQLFDMFITQICWEEVHKAIVLLAKKQSQDWFKKRPLTVLLDIVRQWKLGSRSDAEAVAALKVIGYCVRSMNAANTQYELQPLFELLRNLLLDQKSPPWMQEVVAVTICCVARLDWGICADLIASWQPQQVSIEVLDKIFLDLITKKNGKWWNGKESCLYLNK